MLLSESIIVPFDNVAPGRNEPVVCFVVVDDGRNVGMSGIQILETPRLMECILLRCNVRRAESFPRPIHHIEDQRYISTNEFEVLFLGESTECWSYVSSLPEFHGLTNDRRSLVSHFRFVEPFQPPLDCLDSRNHGCKPGLLRTGCGDQHGRMKSDLTNDRGSTGMSE